MKLGLVSLMRNEADIAPLFLRHVGGLFDHAVLMDHGSIDGTRDLLRAAVRPGWATWDVMVPDFHQDAFTGFAADHLLRTTDVDHVAILDADEFIDVPDRAALVAALTPLATNPRVVAQLTWRNCAPAKPGRPRSGRVWAAPALSPYCKVILPRRLWQESGGRARPGFGNHDVLAGDGVGVDYHRLGEILHVPLRSMMQFKLKILCGMAATAPAKPVRHWVELLDRIAAGTLGTADLAGIAARYGEPGAAPPVADPRRAGFVRRNLADLARDGHRCVAPPPPEPLDRVAAALRPKPSTRPGSLALVGERLDWA